MLCTKMYWHVLYAVEFILTIGMLREFVMSLKVIIYAKQNGAQMATFAATGTRADIDDLRKNKGEICIAHAQQSHRDPRHKTDEICDS